VGGRHGLAHQGELELGSGIVIPQRDIIAWREHAPWPKDTQVEQDLLLTQAMVAIFSDPFLSEQVAMRGGTVLHKVHLAPAARYSEDIDLVLVGDRPEDHVKKALRRVLEPILGKPNIDIFDTVKLAVRNWFKPSRVIRQEYKYRPTMPGQPEGKVKIEVNCTERQPFYAVVDLSYEPPIKGLASPVLLRSYDLDEMIGTKMRALLQRDQGRDLFDLWWALTAPTPEAAHRLDPQRAVAAFADYMQREGTVITLVEYAEELAKKRKMPKFRSDMDTMLRMGLLPYETDAAAQVVSERLLRLLDRK
jgi:predicted nucleotidyltransferase component of viral defense system